MAVNVGQRNVPDTPQNRQLDACWKARELVSKSKHGSIPKEKVDECYLSWRNHASKGNDKKTVLKMDKYYESLWR